MGGQALYYGLNALSNNLIMADRKRLKNPNALILGTPGHTLEQHFFMLPLSREQVVKSQT
jgi:hypothetical protein